MVTGGGYGSHVGTGGAMPATCGGKGRHVQSHVFLNEDARSSFETTLLDFEAETAASLDLLQLQTPVSLGSDGRSTTRFPLSSPRQ